MAGPACGNRAKEEEEAEEEQQHGEDEKVKCGTPEEEDDDEDEEVSPDFECSICMKMFLDPITVTCGHTFCRACIEQSTASCGPACVTCRSPIALGQNVNILIAGIIAEQYPRALARRQRDREEERRRRQAEMNGRTRHADEVSGADEAEPVQTAWANGAVQTARGPAVGGPLPLLPLLVGLGPGLPWLPHCRYEADLTSRADGLCVDYALRGGRRLGLVEGLVSDATEPPLGICLEVRDVAHPEEGARRPRRARFVGRYRFRLQGASPLHQDGVMLGQCMPIADMPLQLADRVMPAMRLSGTYDIRISEDGVAQMTVRHETRGDHPGGAGDHSGGDPDLARTAAEEARSALDMLEQQLERVGENGRRLFEERFGHPPVLSTESGIEVTSDALERLSFWLLGVLVFVESSSWQHWTASVDTRARLAHCRARLQAAGGQQLLNLPGLLSWMHPRSSLRGSAAVLMVLVAMFAAKALGLLTFRSVMVDMAMMSVGDGLTSG